MEGTLRPPGEISREIERMGIERSRLLADNIELDRKSAELAEQVLATDSGVNRWPPRRPRCAARWRPVRRLSKPFARRWTRP